MDLMQHTQTRLVRELSRAFVGDTRTNGETFRKLAEGSPDWMTDVIHECHGGMLPDDWRYRMIERCADSLADMDVENWQDYISETADSLIDVYNAPRLHWLASHLSRAGYIDQARDEGLIGHAADEFDHLGIGQYMEYSEILQALISAIEEQAEDQGPTWADFCAWCSAEQFMQPVIEQADYYSVETSECTEIVPADVCSAEDLQTYCSGKIDPGSEPERKTGFIARMSAPGYTDCTEWAAFDTESEAREYLIEMYGE